MMVMAMIIVDDVSDGTDGDGNGCVSGEVIITMVITNSGDDDEDGHDDDIINSTINAKPDHLFEMA